MGILISPFLLALREKVAHAAPDEGAVAAERDPSPGAISLSLDFATLSYKGKENERVQQEIERL